MRAALGAWLAVLVVLAVAPSCSCGDGGPPNPIQTTSPTADAGPGGAGGDGPGADAGTVQRRVLQRNPLGGPPGNLFVDGDFELSVHGEGEGPQVGWWAFQTSGGGTVNLGYETGGLCRTGLRCAVLEASTMLIGQATAASGTRNRASLWAKVPSYRECAIVDAYFLTCDGGGSSYSLDPVAELPDEQDWCEYVADIPEKQRALCLIVESSLSSGEVVVLDSARLEPAAGTAAQSQAARGLSPERRRRAEAILDWIRRRRPFGRSGVAVAPKAW